MTAAWNTRELDAVATAEELDLQSVGRDGSLRKRVTMWVVRVGDDLYVRSVNGRGASWFRSAQTRHQARIHAGGIDKDVDLLETDEAGEAVDAAYGEKYGRRYPTIVPAIVAAQARAATIKLVPR